MKLSERVFSYFSCFELNDFTPYKPKIFWGRTPRPPPPSTTHLRYQSYHVIRVFVYRGFKLYEKPFPTENKLECKYCLESRFIPYFCRRERGKEQTKTSVSLSLLFYFIFFFLLVKFFWIVGLLPLTKIPGSAPAASSLFCTAVSLGLFTSFSGSCRKYARGR